MYHSDISTFLAMRRVYKLQTVNVLYVVLFSGPDFVFTCIVKCRHLAGRNTHVGLAVTGAPLLSVQ